MKPLLKDTSEMQLPSLAEHHCSAPFDIPGIDMCTFKPSKTRTPPYTGQLTVVPGVSLLQRFHCTGQLTAVPGVSLLQRFHCTGQLTVVPGVSLLQRFHCICRYVQPLAMNMLVTLYHFRFRKFAQISSVSTGMH